MTSLELLKNRYMGTSMQSTSTIGIKDFSSINDLDCDCVDSDCSTDGYES